MSQNQSPGEEAARAMPAWTVSILRWAGVALILGLVFAWFGVYETTQIPFAERIVYWTGLMGVGIVSSIFVNPLIFDRWLPKAHPAIQIGVVAALISVPITIGLFLIEAAGDGTIQDVSWLGQQYLYVIVISVILTAGAWTIERVAEKQAAPAASEAVAAGLAAGVVFADRLPVKFRGAQVYAVSAEDHYLRVHTSAGETLILMRLADAVRELAALEGLQTHRSWWVAKQGLADVARGDGKVTLKLKSGAEAPVSRTYQKAVRDASWG